MSFALRKTKYLMLIDNNNGSLANYSPNLVGAMHIELVLPEICGYRTKCVIFVN